MPYTTVAQTLEREDAIKGSRFIAFVTRVRGVEDAQQAISLRRAAHLAATHNCWAYLVAGELRFSDDGEPGGTAGRPMLEVLQKRELDHVAAVVTRYYGGIKLGAGGLVRAYSGSLAKALDEAGTLEVRESVRRIIRVPFSDMDALHRLLDDWQGLQKGAAAYDANGLVLPVTFFASDVAALAARLEELSRGEGRLDAPYSG